VDHLLVQGQTTVDEEKRKMIYKEAQQAIWNDAPWIPLEPGFLHGHEQPPRWRDRDAQREVGGDLRDLEVARATPSPRAGGTDERPAGRSTLQTPFILTPAALP